MKLSDADFRYMRSAAKNALGVVEVWPTKTGFQRHAWNKRMDKLCDAGLFRPYVHGGYEITDDGRACLAAAEALEAQ